jgi:DNA adenine methylase
VLQRHHVEFFQMIRWRLSSRADFERLKAMNPNTLTDLERAARFLYLQRLAFSGKVTGQNFGVSPYETSGFDVTRLEPQLADLHDRIAAVTIENLPYPDFIARYDREQTLFYLDPPYWASEDDYGANVFSRADFRKLAGLLASITGRFVMSINDVPQIREIFGAFHIEEVETKYMIGKADRAAPARELLISNVEIGAGSLL